MARVVSQDILRLRTLATAEPLHRIRSLSSGTALDWLDHRDIVVSALGALLETWGLGTGTSSDLLDKEGLSKVVAERVVDQASAIGESVTRAAAREYGHKIVEALLNTRERGGEFTTRIYDHENRTHEVYAFRLVEEAESEDNAFYLEPTAHASNLYFQSFLVDVQNELLGQRAALDHHIKSGRTELFVAMAEAHRRTAGRLLAEVRALARRAERSIRGISPDADVGPLLRDVSDAAKEAVTFDQQIGVRLEEQLAIAEEAAAVHIEASIDAVKKARKSFLKARERASSLLVMLESESVEAAGRAPRMNLSLPDLEMDIVAPLMTLPIDDPSVDEMLTALLGAALPTHLVVDFMALADACVPPTASNEIEDDEGDDEGFFEVPDKLVLPLFGEDGEIAADAQRFIMEHGIRSGTLRNLILHQQAKSRGTIFAEALALVATSAFKDQGGEGNDIRRLPGMRLRSSDNEISGHPTVGGTDIVIEEIAP